MAIRGLNSEGAPGPDDIPIFLYIQCWDTVGPEVMETIEDFRAGRCNINWINRACIVLITKVQGAEQIGDFRPISLSNSFDHRQCAGQLSPGDPNCPLPICIYAGSANIRHHCACEGDCGSVEVEGHPGVYVEGGFFYGLRHLRLTVPVERPSAAGVSEKMGTVG